MKHKKAMHLPHYTKSNTEKKQTHLLHSLICQKCKFNRQTLQGLFQSPPRVIIQSSPGRKRCSVWAQSTRRTELMIKFRKQTPLGRCTSLQKAAQNFKELTAQRYSCTVTNTLPNIFWEETQYNQYLSIKVLLFISVGLWNAAQVFLFFS